MTDFGSLTPREIEVARLVGDGLSYLAIGIQLRMSPRTARLHVANADRKIRGQGSTPYRRVQRWVQELRRAA